MMVSFVLSFFPRDVLDEILNLIESVSEDFPSYSYMCLRLTDQSSNTLIEWYLNFLYFPPGVSLMYCPKYYFDEFVQLCT